MKLRVGIAAVVAVTALCLSFLPSALSHTSSQNIIYSNSGRPSHVVVITFDNVHMSEIQQMPHLRHFMENGTLFTNDHTVLNSHTQPDLTSFISGAYPDKTGIVDQGFYDKGCFVTWSYWTNTSYCQENGKAVNMGHPYVLVPPPWKEYNDAGWSLGTVSGADMALESPSEATQYGVINPAVDKTPDDYQAIALYYPSQKPILGSPNIPWIYNAPLLDGSGTVGGFIGYTKGVSALWSLSATYAMLAHGVNATYSYIDDAHKQFDLGDPGWAKVLADYDNAFSLFFQKLATINITPQNTLFVITADEGDHYTPGGERNTGVQGYLTTKGFDGSQFEGYSDSAPPVYYTGDQSKLPSVLEAASTIPYVHYVANDTALAAIHNSTSSNGVELAQRQPSFTLFGDPFMWYTIFGKTSTQTTITLDPTHKWIHGTINPDINSTWLFMAGPGVQSNRTQSAWIDHVDAAPTIEYLLGLPIQSWQDGRILWEALDPEMRPGWHVANGSLLEQLAYVYKMLNAPLGKFSQYALQISTMVAQHATSASYAAIDTKLAALVQQRNTLAPQMQAVLLSGAEATGADAATINSMINKGYALLDQEDALYAPPAS